MATVYVVTTGHHSEYAIEAIYSTREKAEEIRDNLIRAGEDDADIEEFVLDDDGGLAFGTQYKSLVLSDGSIARSVGYEKHGRAGGLVFWHAGPGSAIAEGWSFESPEHADAIAIEERREWLKVRAMQRGVIPTAEG